MDDATQNTQLQYSPEEGETLLIPLENNLAIVIGPKILKDLKRLPTSLFWATPSMILLLQSAKSLQWVAVRLPQRTRSFKLLASTGSMLPHRLSSLMAQHSHTNGWRRRTWSNPRFKWTVCSKCTSTFSFWRATVRCYCCRWASNRNSCTSDAAQRYFKAHTQRPTGLRGNTANSYKLTKS